MSNVIGQMGELAITGLLVLAHRSEEPAYPEELRQRLIHILGRQVTLFHTKQAIAQLRRRGFVCECGDMVGIEKHGHWRATKKGAAHAEQLTGWMKAMVAIR